MLTPKLESHECHTIDAFLRRLRKWAENNNGSPLWYRGMAAHDRPLRPTLYRHGSATDFVELERQIGQWFQQRGIPFTSQSFEDSWHSLFYMQHYGFPTRLLDWSENPLIALYFAVRDPGIYLNLGRASVDIWILSPVDWNRQALGKSDVGILDTKHSFARGYDSEGGDILQRFPSAIYGAHNSMRIAAQRGVFTVFGHDKTDMSEIYETEAGFSGPALRRISFPIRVIPRLLEGLATFGVTPSSVMQDLNHLAMEAKEIYNF